MILPKQTAFPSRALKWPESRGDPEHARPSKTAWKAAGAQDFQRPSYLQTPPQNCLYPQTCVQHPCIHNINNPDHALRPGLEFDNNRPLRLRLPGSQPPPPGWHGGRECPRVLRPEKVPPRRPPALVLSGRPFCPRNRMFHKGQSKPKTAEITVFFQDAAAPAWPPPPASSPVHGPEIDPGGAFSPPLFLVAQPPAPLVQHRLLEKVRRSPDAQKPSPRKIRISGQRSYHPPLEKNRRRQRPSNQIPPPAGQSRVSARRDRLENPGPQETANPGLPGPPIFGPRFPAFPDLTSRKTRPPRAEANLEALDNLKMPAYPCAGDCPVPALRGGLRRRPLSSQLEVPGPGKSSPYTSARRLALGPPGPVSMGSPACPGPATRVFPGRAKAL